MSNMNFAIYFAGDGYSTDAAIMGRQSAGKAFLKGAARHWKAGPIHGFGARTSGAAMFEQLRGDGFSGALHWRAPPGDQGLEELGAVYFPSPPTKALANARNTKGPAAYSLVGVTHTLSSAAAMDQVAQLILPPFKPWDALICTSNAALSVVSKLQEELKAWFSEQTGATRFNPVALPVIPLGVNVADFARTEAQQAAGRTALGLAPDEVAFLFAGRMTFHAKASPVVMYQALEEGCRRTGKTLVCIEAGVYPTPGAAEAFEEARQFLAPSVKFVQIDGKDSHLYDMAWKAADVFVSLSDNIQETFGLTPVEAMAAGLPVLVSDWDGYKDTIRDGVDGYRIPVTWPAAGAGEDLALRHALQRDSYDFYIGRVSMATVVDLAALTDRVIALAESSDLRERLGSAAQSRARESYDWSIILERYVEMIEGLRELRLAAGKPPRSAWPGRPDPYRLFADYPTASLDETLMVEPIGERKDLIETFLGLRVARFALDPEILPRETILQLHREICVEPRIVGSLIRGAAGPDPGRVRALMWLYKLGLVKLRP